MVKLMIVDMPPTQRAYERLLAEDFDLEIQDGKLVAPNEEMLYALQERLSVDALFGWSLCRAPHDQDNAVTLGALSVVDHDWIDSLSQLECLHAVEGEYTWEPNEVPEHAREMDQRLRALNEKGLVLTADEEDE